MTKPVSCADRLPEARDGVSMSEDDLISVVVGRFDPLVACGLAAVLRDDRWLNVLASDVDDAELENAIAQQAPRVVILDKAVPRSLLERLREIAPAIGVLVLADDPSHAYGMRVLAAGATCFARNASPADLLAAVRCTGQGGRIFVTADCDRIERIYPENVFSLTRRETQVLRYLSKGESYAVIALALEIEVETVRKHTVSIRRKLNVHSRHELIGMPVPAGPFV